MVLRKFLARWNVPNEALLDRDDRVEPDAIYFAFPPLDLPEGWKGMFDTAGVPVELDREQLPGSCRGWMSVGTFVALGTARRAAALICPDATLVQAGSFSFGRLLQELPRPAGPLLLAWPMNNYWNTNFPLSQPGETILRYGFTTAAGLDAAVFMERALEHICPVIVHPAFAGDGAAEGRLLYLEGEGVLINHAKPAPDGRGVMVRLVNVQDRPITARLRVGHGPVTSAWICGTLEGNREQLPVVDGMVEIALPPRWFEPAEAHVDTGCPPRSVHANRPDGRPGPPGGLVVVEPCRA